MAENIKQLEIGKSLRSAYLYMQTHQGIIRYFWLVNFLFLGIFGFIPEGFSNPLSMLWLLGYYVYWCGFFRVYYRKKPYFLTMDIFGSMIPSTKIFFITLFAMFLLVILPYLPLLMGFHDRYLIFFENYMQALQNVEGNLLNRLVFMAVLLLMSPIIICRPFFAWISSLQGLNGSMRKAFRKTVGNYGKFVAMMLILNLPSFLVFELDILIGCQGWLAIAFYSLFFIYFNLVFAAMYDFFYTEQTE